MNNYARPAFTPATMRLVQHLVVSFLLPSTLTLTPSSRESRRSRGYRFERGFLSGQRVQVHRERFVRYWKRFIDVGKGNKLAGILRLLLSTTTPCYPWLRIFDRALMRSFRCADQGGRPPSLEESSVVSFIATVNRKPKLSLYIFGGRVIDGQKLLRVTRRARSLSRSRG